jgi:hypothetical protein
VRAKYDKIEQEQETFAKRFRKRGDTLKGGNGVAMLDEAEAAISDMLAKNGGNEAFGQQKAIADLFAGIKQKDEAGLFKNDANMSLEDRIKNERARARSKAGSVAEDKFAKFRKMQGILPDSAMRNKLAMEGYSDEEIEEFFDPQSSAKKDLAKVTQEEVEVKAPEVTIDPKFEKYAVMKKNLPEQVLRHKMRADGLTDFEIDDFFMTGGKVSSAALAKISDEHRKEYEGNVKKFERSALKKKMQRDGYDEATCEALLLMLYQENKEDKKILKKVKKEPVKEAGELLGLPSKPYLMPERKMRAVFITKLQVNELKESLWMDVKEPIVDFITLESKYGQDEKVTQKKIKMKQDLNMIISLFDATRTQNVAIAYGKLRRSPEDIVEIVTRLDDDVMNKAMIDLILKITPTVEERDLVNQREDGELEITGRIFKTLGQIPRLRERLEMQLITQTWDEDATLLDRDFRIVHDACLELKMSDAISRMKLVMGTALAISNFLNGNTPRGRAYGIKIDILNKLDQIRPTDGTKGTLLHHVVDVHLAQFEAEASEGNNVGLFFESWRAVWSAARVNLKQAEDHVYSEIKRKVARAKQELTLIGKTEKAYRKPLAEKLECFVEYAEGRLKTIEKLVKVSC